jgi:pyridoxine kinase
MSVLVGALMNGQSISKALVTACTFVVHCIERNVSEQTDYRYGVNFEQGIPELLKLLGKL